MINEVIIPLFRWTVFALGALTVIPFFFNSNPLYVIRCIFGHNARKVHFINAVYRSSYYYIQKPTPEYNKGSYVFYFHSNRFPYDLRKKYSFKLSEFFKPDGTFINKGTPLCSIIIDNNNHTLYSYILSPIDGYLEYIYDYNEDHKLKNGDLILKVHHHPIREAQKGNIGVNYYYFDQMYDILGQRISYKVIFLCKDGEYVNIGQNIIKLSSTISDEEIVITAKHEGYCDHLVVDFSILSTNKTQILSINENDNIRVNRKYQNIPLIDFDDFTKNTNIRWRHVSGDEFGISMFTDDRSHNIKFSFYHVDMKDWIVFHFVPNKIKFDINDEILFLFENEEVISFKLQIKTQIPILFNRFKVIEYRFLLTERDINLFANNNFSRFKIELKSQKTTYLGGNTGDYLYFEKSNLQIAIIKFANDFVDNLQFYFPDHQFLDIQSKSQSIGSQKIDNACYLYIMKDLSTLYYKIGISNSPQYREKTLQSEKPTIELCASKRYPVRKIAESFEKALHETYKEKRIRGEWFNLTHIEVEHIIESLK